jgi:hypothetical protein
MQVDALLAGESEWARKSRKVRKMAPKNLRVSAGVFLIGLWGLACGGQVDKPANGLGGSTPASTGGAVGGAAGAMSGGSSAGGSRADAGLATGGQAGSQTTTSDATAGPDIGDAPASPRDLAADVGGGTGGSTGAGGIGKTGGATGAGGTTEVGGASVRGGSSGTSDGPVEARSPDAGPQDDSAKDGSTGTDPSDKIVTFHNGVFWNDTKTKRIEAHGGGYLKVGDTWYWFGEDKSQNSGNFKAVNCYASKDLVTWEFRNAIITRSTATQLNTSDRIIERPKVIYNDANKQYVMWVHFENGNYSEASAGVFTSPTVDGNYTFVKSFKPLGNMSRDCNLFKDDDGKAYFMSSANENADMMVYQLTDDYLDVEQLTIKLWAGAKREAPAMFKVGDTYFMITSACTGWDPNQAQYASATAVAGPWTSLTNIGDSTTFDTQSTYVIPVIGSEVTTYIFASDRWQDPDLVSSKYIWLPLLVKGTKLGMDNHTDWSLNLTTGRWTASGSNNYIPQDAWKLIMADSEETQTESDSAVNAFDGLSSTFWHSKYTGGAAPLPHEIQIDLGATYNLTGMSYLTRQDDNDNGVVGQYEFYVSTDSTSWGTAVKTGTFASDHTEKVVTFASKAARYIRFRALSEIQGKQYTAVAELNVIGTAQ